MYRVKINNVGPMKLEKLAAYRTSTAPVDVTVVDNLIAVGDLMKSLCLVRYTPGHAGEPAKLTEVGRHYQTVWSTAIACVGDETFLQSDAEGNLIVLSRNMNGVTAQDKHRLIPTSEISLGEMVNRIRPVNIPQLSSVTVTPRAFMATVSSLQLTGLTGIKGPFTNLFIKGRGLHFPLCRYQPRTSRFPYDPAGYSFPKSQLTGQLVIRQVPQLQNYGAQR